MYEKASKNLAHTVFLKFWVSIYNIFVTEKQKVFFRFPFLTVNYLFLENGFTDNSFLQDLVQKTNSPVFYKFLNDPVEIHQKRVI